VPLNLFFGILFLPLKVRALFGLPFCPPLCSIFSPDGHFLLTPPILAPLFFILFIAFFSGSPSSLPAPAPCALVRPRFPPHRVPDGFFEETLCRPPCHPFSSELFSRQAVHTVHSVDHFRLGFFPFNCEPSICPDFPSLLPWGGTGYAFLCNLSPLADLSTRRRRYPVSFLFPGLFYSPLRSQVTAVACPSTPPTPTLVSLPGFPVFLFF